MSMICMSPHTNLRRQERCLWSEVYEIIHIWTAVVDESEEWSSQWIFQFKQLERRSLKKKLRASTGFEPEVTGSNPGGHGFESRWSPDFFFFFRLLPSNCLNWKIHCDDHSSLSKMSLSLRHSFSDPGHFNNKLLVAFCNDQFQMPT